MYRYADHYAKEAATIIEYEEHQKSCLTGIHTTARLIQNRIMHIISCHSPESITEKRAQAI